MKGIKIFLNKIKTKSDNMVVNDIKISQKTKNKELLSIGKILYNTKKKIALQIKTD